MLETMKNIGHLVQAIRLEVSIFLSKPEWIERNAESWGLTRDQKRQGIIEAYLTAAEKAEIIYGDYEKAHKLREKIFTLPTQDVHL